MRFLFAAVVSLLFSFAGALADSSWYPQYGQWIKTRGECTPTCQPGEFPYCVTRNGLSCERSSITVPSDSSPICRGYEHYVWSGNSLSQLWESPETYCLDKASFNFEELVKKGRWDGTAPACNGSCNKNEFALCITDGSNKTCDNSYIELSELPDHGSSCSFSGKKAFCVPIDMLKTPRQCPSGMKRETAGGALYISKERNACYAEDMGVASLRLSGGFVTYPAIEGTCRIEYRRPGDSTAASGVACMSDELKGLDESRGVCVYNKHARECKGVDSESAGTDAINCWYCDDAHRDKLSMHTPAIPYVVRVVAGTKLDDGRYIYVWKRSGEFLARPYDRYLDEKGSDCREYYRTFVFNHNKREVSPNSHEFHYLHVRHSQLNGSWNPVKAAGEIKVWGGKIVVMNNASGHFKPSLNQTREAFGHLRALGVENVKDIQDEQTDQLVKQHDAPNESGSTALTMQECYTLNKAFETSG